jgi:retron-type reverse transcriptase
MFEYVQKVLRAGLPERISLGLRKFQEQLVPICICGVQGLNDRDIKRRTLLAPLRGGVELDRMDETYIKICSLENLFASWEKFRRGKRSKSDVMAFGRHLEDNLFALQRELVTETYRHSLYEPFTIFDPKQRSIHKAIVKDRIVHQAVVQVIEPFFERRFIFDSYSCRVGKGTHEAVKRLRFFLQKASLNDTRTMYALKCDIRKFFASVSHEKLLQLLGLRIHDQQTLSLLSEIIRSYSIETGYGIPLGNLTSQLFANVYLHELDHFVKQNLRKKYYLRYCDDFIILSESRQHLENLIFQIDLFLTERLSLHLHPNKVFIRTFGQGIDFLGYVLMPHATVLRTKTVRRMLQKIDTGNAASYLGVSGHADAYELEQVLRTRALTTP